MKPFIQRAFTTAMFLSLATNSLRAAAVPESVTLVNGIAALVGESVITRDQVQRFALPAIQSINERYAMQPEMRRQRIDEALVQSLQRLVERRLILQEFADLKANIPESVIQDHVDETIRRDFGADRARLTKTLQEEGSTYEDFRREIRDRFIEAAMRNRNVPRDILISPGRIERYYRDNQDKFQVNDAVQLRMIVIDKSRSPVDPMDLAREIVAKLDEGAEFADMATIYSDGSQARDGGSWGWVERNVLREDLAEIAFNLKAGERSELIDREEAIYLMYAEDTRHAQIRPLVEVRDEIEQTLKQEERKRLEKQWLDRLREKSFVRYFWVIPTSRAGAVASEP
jgi:parvulin-like peptidyl-prolyl isomerase